MGLKIQKKKQQQQTNGSERESIQSKLKKSVGKSKKKIHTTTTKTTIYWIHSRFHIVQIWCAICNAYFYTQSYTAVSPELDLRENVHTILDLCTVLSSFWTHQAHHSSNSIIRNAINMNSISFEVRERKRNVDQITFCVKFILNVIHVFSFCFTWNVTQNKHKTAAKFENQ